MIQFLYLALNRMQVAVFAHSCCCPWWSGVVMGVKCRSASEREQAVGMFVFGCTRSLARGLYTVCSLNLRTLHKFIWGTLCNYSQSLVSLATSVFDALTSTHSVCSVVFSAKTQTLIE
jgi:hypothetical protein